MPLTEEDRSRQDSFVAYCKTCNGLVAAAVKDPEHAKDNAKLMADCIRHGLNVGTLSVAEVRSGNWCKCKKGKR